MRDRVFIIFNRLIVILLMHLVPAAAVAEAEAGKVALVIGNSAYAGEATLPNAIGDAQLIEAALSRLGYETYLIRDLTTRAGIDQLLAYEAKAAQAEIAVIYYAGHGMAVSGQNYLIPVDAVVTSEQSVTETAVPLSRLLDIVSRAANFGVVLFDACRTNPWSRKIVLDDGTLGVQQGLAGDVTVPENVVLGFATQPGQVAYDGIGRNGPYAQALHDVLQANPNREISGLLRNVKGLVHQATAGVQQPAFIDGLSTVDDAVSFNLVRPVTTAGDTRSSVAPDTGWPLLAAGKGSDEEQIRETALPETSVSHITECDRLAGYPKRPRVAGGFVAWSDMDAEAAIIACKLDIFDYPEEPFLYLILARAQTKLDDSDPSLLRYLRKGRTAGEGLAIDLYAKIAFHGLANVEPNRDAAFLLAQLAAANGHPQSLIMIADLFRDTEPTDIARADALYRIARDRGLPEASAKIAWLVTQHYNQKPDYTEVRALYQVAADAGIAWAINNLGVMDARGQGLSEPSKAAALLRYEAACKMDFFTACTNAGDILVNPPFLSPENFERGADLYELACDNGKPKGCFGLGWLHEKGHIQEADPERGRALYVSACDQGVGGACNNLANMLDARHDRSDIEVVLEVYGLWRKACDLNDENGCFALARRLADHGDVVRPGTPQETLDTEIRDLYQRACESGQPRACRSLGALYWNGNFGVQTDHERAAVNYAKACDLGNDWGCIDRARLAWSGHVEIDEDPLDILRWHCDAGIARACSYLGEYMLRDAVGAPAVSKPAVLQAYEIIDQACTMGQRASCLELMHLPPEVGDDPTFAPLFAPIEERILRVAEIDGDFFEFVNTYFGVSEDEFRVGFPPSSIRRFQEGLRDRNLYSGAIDGVVGRQTMLALYGLGK